MSSRSFASLWMTIQSNDANKWMKTKLLISDYRLPNQHKPLTINSYFFELENTLKYTYSSIYIYNYIYRTILVK